MNEYEEGQKCPQCKEGSLQFTIAGACSCHISPPCGACVDAPLVCDTCGWKEADDIDLAKEPCDLQGVGGCGPVYLCPPCGARQREKKQP